MKIIVILLLKTNLLNHKLKGMDLEPCINLDIMEKLCINIDIMKNYTVEYFVHGVVDCRR